PRARELVSPHPSAEPCRVEPSSRRRQGQAVLSDRLCSVGRATRIVAEPPLASINQTGEFSFVAMPFEGDHGLRVDLEKGDGLPPPAVSGRAKSEGPRSTDQVDGSRR